MKLYGLVNINGMSVCVVNKMDYYYNENLSYI